LISTSPATEALWLDVLQRVCGRAAHELKGVLNAVSLNLEVVRSRSQKAEAPAATVASFAASAATQFDAVMDMTEALLALSRPADGPVDLGATTRWLVALLAPPARQEGRTLRLAGSLDSLGTSSIDPSAVRAAIASALLAAGESSSAVAVRADGATLIVQSESDAVLAPVPGDLLAAVREVGIEYHAEPSAISITFPR
jgi:hypothetical protein